MDLDPAAVMAEHRNESTASWTQAGYARFYCWGCQVDSEEVCLPYRLAEALAASEAKVALAEVIGWNNCVMTVLAGGTATFRTVDQPA